MYRKNAGEKAPFSPDWNIKRGSFSCQGYLNSAPQPQYIKAKKPQEFLIILKSKMEKLNTLNKSIPFQMNSSPIVPAVNGRWLKCKKNELKSEKQHNSISNIYKYLC